MAYLTPDTLPADTICRVLFIPNNREFIANVTGALQLLTFADSFVPQGALTPEETAEAYKPMFDAFCFNEGTCRVIGEIITYAGVTSPDPKWLVCDGDLVEVADYPDLYNVIGHIYGIADADHFYLPDLRGRAAAGAGSGPGLTPVVVGDVYGEEDHTLIIAEMPAHSHTDTGHAHSEIPALPTAITIGVGAPAPSALPGIGFTGSASANLTDTGGDGGHNNIGPRLGITYLIVALS